MLQQLLLPCPNCHQDLRGSPELIGRRVRCRFCGHAFLLEQDDGSSRFHAHAPVHARLGLDRLRVRAAETDRLEEELRDERARADRLRAALRESGAVKDPREPSQEGGPDTIPHRPWPDSGSGTDLNLYDMWSGDPADGPDRDQAPDAADRHPLEGRDDVPTALVIPGYEVLGTICDGAMGRVLRARQVSVDRIVAIKVLRDAYIHHEEYSRRFRREAQIAARLSHPNIITTLDAGEVDGRPYLVMEHVDGETIQDRLDRQHLFDEATALRITLAAAEALGYLHRLGLIHRDVKPANVILTPEGGVKLTDMGLARPIDDEAWALAEAGTAVGTPEYISPEQIRGQVDVDLRSDLYNLGATLYHMVTGHVPYSSDTVAGSLRKHLDPKTVLIPPDSLNPALSSSLSAVVGMMMARNRCDRYQVTEDLILDLEHMLRGDRPLLAGHAPESLAPLALGDTAPPRSNPGVEATARACIETASERTGDDRTWGLLLVVPTLVLALSLLGTVAFLMVP